MSERPTESRPPEAETTTAGEGGPAPDTPPTFAGRYAIGEEIARGGMGVVYKATDTTFDRPVAVKVLRSGGTARRFADEARITGQLQHPAIPPVHDLGTLPDGTPFLAMKLIKGETLDQRLKDRPDPAADRGRFVAAFEQVCQAVAYAHAHRVIHRDLKPANVMVGSFGEVQVMDWGLAKVLTDDPVAAGDPAATSAGTVVQSTRDSDADRTQAGSVLGTPAYMPPEQALGAVGKVDARSDVFGLGAILAVILTGKPPFVGTSVETTRIQAAQGKVEECFARLDASGSDPELVALCKHCLTPEPAGRPADAGAVATAVADLRAAADERARQADLARAKAEVQATEQRKRRRVQMALVAAVLVIAAGGGAAAWWADKQARDRQATALQHQLESERRDADEHARTVSNREMMVLASNSEKALENPDSVIATCREAIRLDPDSRLAHHYLALALEANEDWAAAAAAFRAAIPLNPQERNLHDNLGGVLRSLGNQLKEAGDEDGAAAAHRESVAAYRELIRLTPGSSFSYARLGDALAETGDLVAAEAAYREGVRIGPTDESTHRYLVQYLQKKGKTEDAVAVCRDAARLNPDRAWPYSHLAEALAEKRDWTGAVAARREAVRLDPKDAHVHYQLGDALGHAGDPVGALAAYREYVRLYPTDAYAHFWLARGLANVGDIPGAVAAHQESVRLAPSNDSFHDDIPGLLSSCKDLEVVLAACREDIRLNPGVGWPYIQLGRVLAQKGDWAGAVAAHREAIRITPNNAEYLSSLGKTLAEQGDFDGAVVAFREAIRLRPKPAKYHFSTVKSDLAKAERQQALLGRLADVLAGKSEPASPAERCEFAELCATPFQNRFADAARLYEEAFAADLKLAAETAAQHRYAAACYAARAARGDGVGPPPGPADRAALRCKALAWLRADLAQSQGQAASTVPGDRNTTADLLTRWLQDPDLSAVRQGIRRIGMPAAERAEWDKLWADVKATIDAAKKPPVPK